MHEIEQQLVIFFSFADLGYFDCCDMIDFHKLKKNNNCASVKHMLEK